VCGADDKCATPATFTQVFAILRAQNCTHCHHIGSANGGFVETTAKVTYGLLLEPPRKSVEQDLYLVQQGAKPGDAGLPNESYLYQKVVPFPTISYSRMGSLSAAEKNQIYTWILDGAKNN
jgi:hypothetical protein